MTVDELREQLADHAGYLQVMAGGAYATEVREVGRREQVRDKATGAGLAVSSVVLVIA